MSYYGIMCQHRAKAMPQHSAVPVIVFVASTALCPSFSTPSLPLPLLLPLPLIAPSTMLPLSVILDGIVRLRWDDGDKVFLLSVTSHEDARRRTPSFSPFPSPPRNGSTRRRRPLESLCGLLGYGRGLCVFRGTQAGARQSR